MICEYNIHFRMLLKCISSVVQIVKTVFKDEPVVDSNSNVKLTFFLERAIRISRRM